MQFHTTLSESDRAEVNNSVYGSDFKELSFSGATEVFQRYPRSIYSKRFHERFPVLGNWNRIEISRPQKILYFCFFLEHQWLRFLLTFWDLPETFVQRLFKYTLNCSYWRSVGLKHIKGLAKEGHRALSLQFSAYNANKLSWLCTAKGPITLSWNWYHIKFLF